LRKVELKEVVMNTTPVRKKMKQLEETLLKQQRKINPTPRGKRKKKELAISTAQRRIHDFFARESKVITFKVSKTNT